MRFLTLLNLSIFALFPCSFAIAANTANNIQTNAQLVEYLQKKFEEKGISTSIRMEGSIDSPRKKLNTVYKKVRETGLIKRTIIINKNAYNYSIYIPALNKSDSKILVVVPSEKQEITNLQEMTGFNEVSDKKGFLVVYPEILKASDYSKDKKINYTDYLEKIVSNLQEEYKNSELYLTSWAEASFNLWDLVCQKNIKIKGMAVVGSSFLQRHTNDKCKYDYPSLFINATSDLIVPYDGRKSYVRNEELLGMDKTIEFLTDYNKIKQPAIKKEIFNSEIDYTRVKKETYHTNGKVLLINYKIQFAGHIWPGTSTEYPIKQYGRKTGQLNATEVIADFINGKY